MLLPQIHNKGDEIMKKYFRIVAIVLLIAMSITAFASCKANKPSEPDPLEGMTDIEKITYLSQKSDEYYASQRITKTKQTMTLSGTVADVSIKNTTELYKTETVLNPGTEQFSCISVSDYITKTKSGSNEESVETYTQIEGFTSGEMFFAYIPKIDGVADEDNDFYSKSPCSPSDYEAFLKYQIEKYGADIDESNCNTVSIQKDESGKNWIIKLSNLNDSAKSKLSKALMVSSGMLPMALKVKNFQLTLTVDASTMALVKSVNTAEFETEIIDQDYYKISISTEESYSLPESGVSTVPERYDYYRNTGDLRYVVWASDAINEIVSSSNMRVNFEGLAVLKASAKGHTQTLMNVGEKDRLDFGEKEGTFVFHIANEMYSRSRMLYNGKEQIKSPGTKNETKQRMNEFTARIFLINNFFAPYSFSQKDISKVTIEDMGKGQIEVTFSFNQHDIVETVFKELGKVSSPKTEVTVLFDANGQIIYTTFMTKAESTLDGVRYKFEQESKLHKFGTAYLNDVTVVK